MTHHAQTLLSALASFIRLRLSRLLGIYAPQPPEQLDLFIEDPNNDLQPTPCRQPSRRFSR
jgi:hypothetical protein